MLLKIKLSIQFFFVNVNSIFLILLVLEQLHAFLDATVYFFSLFSFFKSQIINDIQDLRVCEPYFVIFSNFSSRLLQTIVSFFRINEIFQNLYARMTKGLLFPNQFEF